MASGRVDSTIRGANPAAALPQPARLQGFATFRTPTISVGQLNRFPGDPGSKVLHGLNDNSDAAFAAVQTAVGHTFKLRRSYSGLNWGMDTNAVDEDIAAGRIPVTSWREKPYTLTTVPDSAIDDNINLCLARAPAPMWCTFYHEPEDNFPTDSDAADYRALFRRTVLRFRASGATNVAWVSPFFQTPFTWTNRDWRKWHPDWKGTSTNTSADWWTGSNSVIDIDGLDSYIPLIGSTNWQTFSFSFGSKVMTKMTANGYTPKPFLIGEQGVKSDTVNNDTTLGPSRMQDVFETAASNNFVGICWWNTGLDSFLHGETPSSDPGGLREAKLASIMADSRSG